MPHPSPRALDQQSRNRATTLVQKSWVRCAQYDPRLLADPNPLSRADLSLQMEAHRILLRHAEPSLCALGALAGANDGIAILAAPNGIILSDRGDSNFLDKAQRVALRPGVSWAESERGTNAIGTALHEGRAIRIHGAEHFLARNKMLSCHAAPILSGTGKVLGILDFSASAESLCAYALALVQQLAAGISDSILAASPLQRIEFHPGDRGPAAGDRTAILLLDEAACIVGANEAALHALNTDWQLLGTPCAEWIDGTLQSRDTVLRRRDGQPLTGRCLTPDARGRHFPVSGKAAPATVRGSAAGALPEPDVITRPLLEQAVRAVDSGLAVLLQGETGTGKEVMARHIHAHSQRHGGAFVAVNCAALPEHLIESELFGYERGAFTGARREGARGLLRQANGGTLFLDEIGDLPLCLQTRLLRVLQEREVQPLGSNQCIALEFNLISASHQNLPDRVAKQQFRADLYYRLQDFPIELPPLRERPDLAEWIAKQYAALGGTLGARALQALAYHPWPGNYRELLSILRRLRCQYPEAQTITVQQLPETLLPPAPTNMPSSGAAPAGDGSAPPSGSNALQELELFAIRQALHACDGNMTLAARQLGIHRSTLYRKLKKHLA